MLAELRVHDLAIIDRLELTFGPGLNVLTGETGAGKSIIIDAVGLLLGDRASQEIVRGGAERTEVEGTFLLAPQVAERIAPILSENGLEDEQPDVLTVAREVRANGRSVARVNGRAVNTGLLAELCQQLVDVHGQGEHLSLLREREHLGLLDRYAGLVPQRTEMADLVRRVRSVQKELDGLRQDERERARRIDLLQFQVDEIESAHLQRGEIDELDAERRRLANAEQLSQLSSEAVMLLQEGDEERMAAVDAIGTAEASLQKLVRIDPDAEGLLQSLSEASELVADVGRELVRYRDSVEFNPNRLAEVEERLGLIRSLQRKYGETIEEMLAYGERAARELEQVTHAEERIAELEAQEAELLAAVGRMGSELSALRRAAGFELAAAIERELADLQMARARFGVQITWSQNPAGAPVEEQAAAAAGESGGRYGFDLYGLDHVSFLVSANPGEPLRPLARVASGGETSRLMLALKAVLGRADQTPTLIFDEIDVGIGGRVGATVGEKLWGLTSAGDGGVSHQVLCITHLPQLAAYGDSHFHVSKEAAGDRTRTVVQSLTGDERVIELARMMGADSESGRASVQEIMGQVRQVKQTETQAQDTE